MTHIPYLLREATKEDESFIYNSSLKFIHKLSNYRNIRDSIFFHNQSEIIRYLLNNSKVLIACFPEAPEEIMGYIIYEHLQNDLILHFVYVKFLHRHKGLIKEIMQSILRPDTNMIVYTHYPDFNVTKLAQGRLWVFDPYYITNQRINKL